MRAWGCAHNRSSQASRRFLDSCVNLPSSILFHLPGCFSPLLLSLPSHAAPPAPAHPSPRLNCIQTDHKAVMAKMEKSLHALHEARALARAAAATASPTAAPPSSSSSAPAPRSASSTAAGTPPTLSLVPIAKVNQVCTSGGERSSTLFVDTPSFFAFCLDCTTNGDCGWKVNRTLYPDIHRLAQSYEASMRDANRSKVQSRCCIRHSAAVLTPHLIFDVDRVESARCFPHLCISGRVMYVSLLRCFAAYAPHVCRHVLESFVWRAPVA